MRERNSSLELLKSTKQRKTCGPLDSMWQFILSWIALFITFQIFPVYMMMKIELQEFRENLDLNHHMSFTLLNLFSYEKYSGNRCNWKFKHRYQIAQESYNKRFNCNSLSFLYQKKHFIRFGFHIANLFSFKFSPWILDKIHFQILIISSRALHELL